MFSFLDLKSFLTVMFLGISCSCFYAYYEKKFIGGFVRALDKSGALDESSCKEIHELGYKKNGIKQKLILRAMKKGSFLSRCVVSTPNGYYLSESFRENALHRYRENGTNVVAVLLAVALFGFAVMLCTLVIPFLSNMALGVPESFGSVKGDMAGYTQQTQQYDADNPIVNYEIQATEKENDTTLNSSEVQGDE